MKVILLEDVKSLGKKGELVEVYLKEKTWSGSNSQEYE